MWGKLADTDLKTLSLNTRVAAQVMLERLRADAKGIRRDFACFSLRRISIALQVGPGGAAMLSQLVSAVKNLAKAFVLDQRVLELEYTDALPVMLKHWKLTSTPGAKNCRGKSFTNLTVWQKLLDRAFVELSLIHISEPTRR